VFNITRGEGRSLKEFAEILSRIVPGVSTVEVPANEIRPKRGALDISKARRMLGYEPQYSLENGLEDYVEFVRKFIGSKEL
jgi:nucleoside-diphosphate-sugar epimerase